MIVLLPAGSSSINPYITEDLTDRIEVVFYEPGPYGEPDLSLIPHDGYVWVFLPGAYPAVGALDAVQGWLEQRLPAGIYGYTVTNDGLFGRPRMNRLGLWVAPSIGSSLVVRAGLLRKVLSDPIVPREWWYQLRVEATETGLDHMPVKFEYRESLDLQPATERPRVLKEITGVNAIVHGAALVPQGATDNTSVSVVIPSIGAEIDTPDGSEPAIVRCVRSLRTTADVAEIIVVAGPRMPDSVLEEVTQLAGDLLHVVRVPDPFNFSTSCNTGVLAATGSHVLLLNDDVEATEPGWLDTMLGTAVLPGVGAVGAQLLFPDGTIQHAGVIVNPRTLEPNHLYMHHDPATVADPIVRSTAEFLVVTGACLLVDRELYLSVGGLTEELPLNYNDVDFCLKLVAAGYTNLQCNTVSLIHRESTSRDPHLTENEATWMDRWEPWIALDPYVYVWL